MILAVVVILAAGAIVWLSLDRRGLARDVVGSQRQIEFATAVSADLQQQVARLEEQVAVVEEANAAAGEGLRSCVRALEDGVRLYNALVRELAAAGDLDQAEASRLQARAEELRDQANRSLEACRTAVAG